MNEKQLQAMRLVNCGNGGGLTEYANVLVSRQAKTLLSLGWIAYAPERRNVGYKITSLGYRELEKADPEYPRYVDYLGGPRR